MVVPAPVAVAYRRMRAIENQIGGGEGVVGIYGSLGATGMQTVLDSMVHQGLGSQSVFVDVGTGLGKPLVHALLFARVRKAYGYEFDEIKYVKARTMMKRLRDVYHVLTPDQYARIRVKHRDVGEMPSLPDGTTHVYSFWQGFSTADKMALGALWAASPTARCITVVGNMRAGWAQPVNAMQDLGFGPLTLTFTGSVTGPGSFTAWTFVKN